MEWKDGWPVILPPATPIPGTHARPALPRAARAASHRGRLHDTRRFPGQAPTSLDDAAQPARRLVPHRRRRPVARRATHRPGRQCQSVDSLPAASSISMPSPKPSCSSRPRRMATAPASWSCRMTITGSSSAEARRRQGCRYRRSARGPGQPQARPDAVHCARARGRAAPAHRRAGAQLRLQLCPRRAEAGMAAARHGRDRPMPDHRGKVAGGFVGSVFGLFAGARGE